MNPKKPLAGVGPTIGLCSFMTSKLIHLLTAGAVSLATLSGCASTRLDAQWVDPQFTGTSLRGARVLVACEAAELVLKQMCEDRVISQMLVRGAMPLVAKELTIPTADAYAQAARQAGATAALVVQVTAADARTSAPFSIGLGGFGIGDSGFRGGVGVSVPIGGGRTAIGYAANGRLTEASSGRLMWTGRASAPPSNNPAAQLDELATSVLGGVEKAGFF